jgi:hypothetical protein
MSRKPAQIELIGGKSPRQCIWDAVRHLDKKSDAPFTQSEVQARCHISSSQIRDYFKGLVKAGFISIVGSEEVRGVCTRNSYRISRNNGVDAPRVDKAGNVLTEGSANERMWGTLRRMFKGKPFNYTMLAAHASTSANPIAVGTAKAYVQALFKAGYIDVMSESRTGKRAAIATYTLQRDTGSRAPMIQRTKLVYDPNLNQVVWIQKGEQDE